MFSSSSLSSTQKYPNGSSTQLKLNPIPGGIGLLNNEHGKMMSKPAPRQAFTGILRPGPRSISSPALSTCINEFSYVLAVHTSMAGTFYTNRQPNFKCMLFYFWALIRCGPLLIHMCELFPVMIFISILGFLWEFIRFWAPLSNHNNMHSTNRMDVHAPS